ncbi:uncharacterized protein LOC129717376 [Wyeomyia smithii]|uniref:uncharacterized protein LOC129717376 n=1 Tax=Wyeomyia smithii TaxID=174621 RepID=UPI002467DDB6|nr:uncharacterized protein LOC129717376 [Wyeomyia smithii]
MGEMRKRMIVPHLGSTENDKDEFYVQLDREYDHCPEHDIKIVIGDFNAQIGQEEEYKPVIRGFSAHQRTNEIGLRLIDFAALNNMAVRNLARLKLEENQLEEGPLEDCWNIIKTAINSVAENDIGHVGRTRRKEWFDDKCRRVMDEENAARAAKMRNATRQNA